MLSKATFCALFLSGLASPGVVALSNLVWDLISREDTFAGREFVDRLVLFIAQLKGTLLGENGVDTTGQMGSSGADGLGMMFTVVDHLLVVDGGELDIPLAHDVGVEIEGGFNQIGACLDPEGSPDVSPCSVLHRSAC